MANEEYLSYNAPDGVIICKSDVSCSVFGATPVSQGSAITAVTTATLDTTAVTTGASGAACYTSTQADLISARVALLTTRVNSLSAQLKSFGIIA